MALYTGNDSTNVLNNPPTATNDTVNGLGGDDLLYGGGGNDTLNGGTGDDILIGGIGFNRLDGWTGNDEASYLVITTGVTVDLAEGVAYGAWGSDVLLNIESITGSGSSDRIEGDDRGNRLRGEDVISLIGIDARPGLAGNQAFTFVGSHTVGTEGQVTSVTGLGITIVSVFVDGDATADTQILMLGTLALNASDFQL